MEEKKECERKMKKNVSFFSVLLSFFERKKDMSYLHSNSPSLPSAPVSPDKPFDLPAFFAFLFVTLALFSIGGAILEYERYLHPEKDVSKLMEIYMFSAVGVTLLFLFATVYILHTTNRMHPISGIAVGAGLSILMIHFGLVDDARDKKQLEKAMIGWCVTSAVFLMMAMYLLHRAYVSYEEYEGSLEVDPAANLYRSAPSLAGQFFPSQGM